MTWRTTFAAGLSGLVAVLATGCGSSASQPTSKASASPTTTSSTTTSAAQAPAGPGALSAEARSTGTGDIPDNQVFLVFTNKAAGYAIKYPEGWTQNGSARTITFSDKNNLVRVVIGNGGNPTVASVSKALETLKHSNPSLTFTAPRVISLPAGSGVATTYRTESAPDPVTGRRVTLLVDRYVVARGGRVATVDLGTPKGVDNVDAYRMMIQSFRWL